VAQQRQGKLMNIASLSQYAKHKDGTYVSLEMTKESRELLDNFVANNLGLTDRVDPKTYHITVIYSRTPVPSAEQLLHMNTALPVEAQPISYEVFPTKTNGKCLVLRLVCPYATRINSQLTIQGATSDYAEYKAHVTIAYNMQQEVNPDTLPVPQFQLEFDRLNVAPLDPLFTPANK
jgi:2'-5' RNA ligase